MVARFWWVVCIILPIRVTKCLAYTIVHIENSLERLLESNPGASVVLAGDFNKLDLTEVSARVGLLPLVSQPTRGTKVLDMIMTSDPLSYSIKVVTSTVRSDHKAVLATTTLQKDITKAPI